MDTITVTLKVQIKELYYKRKLLGLFPDDLNDRIVACFEKEHTIPNCVGLAPIIVLDAFVFKTSCLNYDDKQHLTLKMFEYNETKEEVQKCVSELKEKLKDWKYTEYKETEK